jgi:hypothetical protein
MNFFRQDIGDVLDDITSQQIHEHASLRGAYDKVGGTNSRSNIYDCIRG